MIPITPLNDKTVLISVRSIERIEQMPETVLVLTGGRRMVVVDLAQDVVKRIERVHATVVAMAAAGSTRKRRWPGGRLSSTAFPQAAPDCVEPESAPAGLPPGRDPEQTISTTNLLHTGQIALDRVLAAVARCRWLADQRSMDDLYRRELGKALEALDGLAGTLQPGQIGGPATSLAEVLGGCRDQLGLLLSRDQDEMSVREADNIMRTIHASISKIRKVWARIAADTSWGAIADSLEPTPPRATEEHPGSEASTS
jgi:flagellar protein FlbD